MRTWLYRRLITPLHEGSVRRRPTLRYYDQLMESQWKSPENIRELQWEALEKTVRLATKQVPYYRQRYGGLLSPDGSMRSFEDFARLPMLSKDDLRQHQKGLVAEGYDARRLYVSHSGGSTGEPVEFRFDRDSLAWRTAGWWRADSMAGWFVGAKTIMFWLGIGGGRTWQRGLSRLKERIHWMLKRWKVLTCSKFTEEDLRRYVGIMWKFRPDVFYGLADATHVFGRFLKATGLRLPPLRGVILGAEKVFEHQKAVIAEGFGAPVHERYGTQEVCNIAMECEAHDGMHLNAENVYLEVVDENGQPAEPGQVGEVLITTLTNFAMPLIRYRLGDLAVLDGDACRCGRGLPKIKEVVGRTLDVIVTPDGRYCCGVLLPHVMKEFPEVREFQVYQPSIDRVILRVVPAEGFSKETVRDLQVALKRFLGEAVALIVEPVSEIPRLPTGKYRLTVSEVDTAQTG